MRGLDKGALEELRRTEVLVPFFRVRLVDPDPDQRLEFPTGLATVVAERVAWQRSIRVIRERVAELRPLFVPPGPCKGPPIGRTCSRRSPSPAQ